MLRPSQDSSVWLGSTSREKLMSPECSKHKLLYIYIYIYTKVTENVPCRGKTKLFSVRDQKISAKHHGNIWSFSRYGKLYDRQEKVLNYLK